MVPQDPTTADPFPSVFTREILAGAAQYFGVHHKRNEEEGEHGLVEKGLTGWCLRRWCLGHRRRFRGFAVSCGVEIKLKGFVQPA